MSTTVTVQRAVVSRWSRCAPRNDAFVDSSSCQHTNDCWRSAVHQSRWTSCAATGSGSTRCAGAASVAPTVTARDQASSGGRRMLYEAQGRRGPPEHDQPPCAARPPAVDTCRWVLASDWRATVLVASVHGLCSRQHCSSSQCTTPPCSGVALAPTCRSSTAAMACTASEGLCRGCTLRRRRTSQRPLLTSAHSRRR